jgi:tetratricopeptide (TPR) repeat protein
LAHVQILCQRHASTAVTSSPAAETPFELWTRRLTPLFLFLATLAAYANSFSGPFIFDDFPTIVENPTIRQLWPLTDVLSPPSDTGLTVNGRPLVNLSLALNHAINGIDPRGYHVFNFLCHVLAGLTLFGLVRRILLQPTLGPGFGRHAAALAFSIALIWLLHPLQTAAVTYIVQRAEVMVGFFYLVTLYGFIRSIESPHVAIWKFVSVAACAAGMATKEVMVSAPLIVFLFDRTFVAGSFRKALAHRWRLHVSLAATWLILASLMVGSGGRGGTAGFSLPVSPVEYAITQVGAVIHYLRLAFWPHPLVFDYGGTVLVKNLSTVWPQAVLLVVLIAGSLLALKRNHALGFAGACFFAILAPSSSIVPVADTMFEHRVYLPLAAVIAILCAAVFQKLPIKSLLLFALIAAALGVGTARRNHTYSSELALWSDTVAKRPENVRAHYTLGSVLAENGRIDDALEQYRLALELKPDSFEAHNNLGNLLTRAGQLDEAREHYEFALRVRPTSADAHNNLGNALLQSGRAFQAMEAYQAALRLDPAFADAHNNLANLHMRLGEIPSAIEHYEAALRSRAGFFDAHLNLANALAESGLRDKALSHYEAALKLRPDSAELHYNLGVTLDHLGDATGAAAHYEQALVLSPGHQNARNNLARLRASEVR